MMSDHANNQMPQASSDVFWEAARYVWDEMEPSERASFEARLATDEAACAAVAEAVTLSAGLVSAVRPPMAVIHGCRSPLSASRRLVVWICAAAVAGIGFVLLTSWNLSSSSNVDLAAAELVDLWTSAAHSQLIAEADGREDIDADAEMVDEGLAAPRWMLDAVQLTSKRSASVP
jgi:hypothetical protein